MPKTIELNNELNWKAAEGISTVPGGHCFEAEVENGKYRVAPWLHVDRSVHYEAFFIPAGAESMADVRDIDIECRNIADAKEAAQRDHDRCGPRRLSSTPERRHQARARATTVR